MRHHAPSRNSRNFDSNRGRVDDRKYSILCNMYGFFWKNLRIYLKRHVVNIFEAKNLDIFLPVKDVDGILFVYYEEYC